MLLQVALDKPEHLSVLPRLRGIADIIEIGTPLLKRFGVGAIATARELCPGVPVLADTKTVDGGDLEAEMVFGAGARLMTVLSSCAGATHAAVDRVASRLGGLVVVDTITESGKPEILPANASFPPSFAYVGVHSPTDVRVAGDRSTGHIDAVAGNASPGLPRRPCGRPRASDARRRSRGRARDHHCGRRHHGRSKS